MRIFAIIAAALICPLAAIACAVSESPTPAASPTPSQAPADTGAVSRQEVLVNLTDTVMVPRYQAVAAEMDSLRDALHTLCANPTPDALDAARTAWRQARAPWMRTQAFWFGTVMERRSLSLLDWSPVEPARIETMLSERDAVAASDVTEFLAATQRGLGAIEYIIFSDDDSDGDGDGNDAAILAALTPADSIRCQYLTALGEVSAAETAGILADWTGANAAGKAYAGYFNGTAASSLLGKAAVDEIVRHSVFLTRSITDMRLGAALDGNGGIEGGNPDPDALLAGPGHNTVADIRNQVLGMQDLYQGGATGPGVGALVRGISPDADDRMTVHFGNVLMALDGLSEPLPESIAGNPEPARNAHRQLQEFQRALNTEVVSLLGVSVGFADTDGDGG